MALGPVKGHFATAGRCLVQCREQCSVCVCVCVCVREREREEGCCDKKWGLVRCVEQILQRE